MERLGLGHIRALWREASACGVGGARCFPAFLVCMAPSPEAIGPRHRKTPREEGHQGGLACIPLSWRPRDGARLGLTPSPSYFMSVIKYVKIKSLL